MTKSPKRSSSDSVASGLPCSVSTAGSGAPCVVRCGTSSVVVDIAPCAEAARGERTTCNAIPTT